MTSFTLLPPHADAPLSAWLSYLEQLHTKTIDLGLDRIHHVAKRLDLLKPASFVFTVAGTNGKGTTCRMLEVLLMAADYRVGVYSSPHLLRYTERVRIQGDELAEYLHTAAFSTINTVREDISLTYFEFGALSALMLFKQAKVDVVILEVGLGGRLDATNIIDADLAVITSIALDHTDWLGTDRESIGREKAGIFRRDQFAIIGEPEMPHSIAVVAQEKGTSLLCVDRDWHWQAQGTSWEFTDQQGVLSELPLPQIPLPNAATAIAALRTSPFNVDEHIIRQHIATVSLPGRFQKIAYTAGFHVILDVAHNPHAAAYLATQIAQLPKEGSMIAVVAMLQDKDIAATLGYLVPLVDQWHCASLEGPRGATAKQLASYLPQTQTTEYPSVKMAWQAARQQAQEKDIILVFGSFYTVSQVLEEKEHEEKSINDQ